jgi:hypothetical protein
VHDHRAAGCSDYFVALACEYVSPDPVLPDAATRWTARPEAVSVSGGSGGVPCPGSAKAAQRDHQTPKAEMREACSQARLARLKYDVEPTRPKDA